MARHIREHGLLASYDSTSGHWVNSVMANTGNDALGGELAYQGSFAQFQNTYGDMLPGYIGAYGVDTTNGVAWAVLDHNSQFGVGAAVPEPSTLAMGFTGLVCLLLLAWRRRDRTMGFWRLCCWLESTGS